jgi:hypothetical protein
MREHPVLDADLFASLRQALDSVNDVEVLQSMVRVDRGEFTRFVTDEVENPKFLHESSVFDMSAATSALAECVDVVESSSAPEVVVQLYRAKLKNQQLRFELLDAAAQRDDERFCATSKLIYGSPNKTYFAQIVHHALARKPNSTSAEKASKLLTDELSHVVRPTAALPVEMLPPLALPDEPALTSEQVAIVFREIISEQALEGWDVEIDTTGRRLIFSVNPTKRLVYVPNDEHLTNRYRPLTQIATEAIAAHEIGVHATRAHRGSQQPLRLLSLGLDGYLKGEEGLASYCQQQVEGADLFYGQDRYLALGLALGLDGEARDFRAVFVLMRAYYQLHSENADAAADAIIRRTWEVCRRIFRGTTGQTTGCVNTRYLVYFEGNVEMWNYLINHPERFPHLFVGKFDPLNERHVTSLQTLEILPQW